MYNVKLMKQEISQAVELANLKVRNEFKTAFKEIYQDSVVPYEFPKVLKIKLHKLTKATDLDNVLSGEGFYIILTDLELEGNVCTLTYSNGFKAIYRGECRTTRKRLQSHLFNKCYKSQYEERKRNYLNKDKKAGKEFYEPFWSACLKVGSENGLDINELVDESNWIVIVHNMIGSSQEVRVQAELAFDEVFGKPIASREKT
ncbi:hypothetical protein P3748_05105 [Vibrio parahaemolyticus]|nr:hypothetical protein [Vibrio parahaemolyticus]MDF5037799.1 hypothetical protein [Vibrio parahaemolyticus]MDF5684581.1 hypothetical protein [Vibrio parahaemolyticus]